MIGWFNKSCLGSHTASHIFKNGILLDRPDNLTKDASALVTERSPDLVTLLTLLVTVKNGMALIDQWIE